MPGLAGFVPRSRPILGAAETVALMGAALSGGMPLSRGQIGFDLPRAEVAWALPKGSFADRLPIWNAARTVCLLFSGEHFPASAEYERSGAPAAGLSQLDARWLVCLYESVGLETFFAQLNGAFCGVLVDSRNTQAPQLVLFNDRHGQARLYCHENQHGTYFASEAKALFAAVPELRQLDPLGTAELLTCGCPLGTRTLFRGVSTLPPASAWSWNPAGPSRRIYFSPTEWERQKPLLAADYQARLAEVLPRIVRRYVASSQAVALSATGGLDTRMVLAALKPPPGTLPFFTFDGMYRECADARVGRQLAAATGQVHHRLRLAPHFLSQFTELATECVRLTDGAMDVSGAANLLLNRQAREIAPIRLTGNYGGEILRRLWGLRARSPSPEPYDPGLAARFAEAEQALAPQANEHPLSAVAFRQIPSLNHGMAALESFQLTVRTPFLDRELVALAYRAPPESLGPETGHRFVHAQNPALARIPNDRGAVWRYRDPPSPRSRLRRAREEFLPLAEYAFDYGMPPWLARLDHIFPLRWERLFLGRQKFVHFRIWYRRELAPQIQAVLLDPRSLARAHVNRRGLESVVRSHIRGTANHTLTLHKLLSLELLHRTLLD